MDEWPVQALVIDLSFRIRFSGEESAFCETVGPFPSHVGAGALTRPIPFPQCHPEEAESFAREGLPTKDLCITCHSEERSDEESAVVRHSNDRRGAPVTVVMGMLDRDERKIRATVVSDVKRETLQNEVLKNVKYGSLVFTDDAVPYDKLHWRYIHEVVNHAESYVKGRVHTNGLENFWSLLKRGLRGTYVAVEPFHLER